MVKKEDVSRDTGKKAERGKKVTYTHFLSIPVQCEVLKHNYAQLKEEILSHKTGGIRENNFTRSVDHHLTVLMLDLKDKDKLDMAKQLLKSQEN